MGKRALRGGQVSVCSGCDRASGTTTQCTLGACSAGDSGTGGGERARDWVVEEASDILGVVGITWSMCGRRVFNTDEEEMRHTNSHS